jgi:hypothetical protein
MPSDSTSKPWIAHDSCKTGLFSIMLASGELLNTEPCEEFAVELKPDSHLGSDVPNEFSFTPCMTEVLPFLEKLLGTQSRRDKSAEISVPSLSSIIFVLTEGNRRVTVAAF